MPDVKSYECDGPECEVLGRATKTHTYRPARPDRWIEMDLTQTDGSHKIQVAFCSLACYQRFAVCTDWNPDVGFSFYGRELELSPSRVNFESTPARGPHAHQRQYAFERTKQRCGKSCCAWRFRFRHDLAVAQRLWPSYATHALARNVEVLEALSEL